MKTDIATLIKILIKFDDSFMVSHYEGTLDKYYKGYIKLMQYLFSQLTEKEMADLKNIVFTYKAIDIIRNYKI